MKEAIKKVQVERECQATIEFLSATKKAKQENSTDLTAVKVNNKHHNQVVVKKEKFKLNFTKFDGATNVKDDSSVKVTHDTIDVDEFRINPIQ